MTKRLAWMDGTITLSSGDFASAYHAYNVSVYPNPVQDQLNILLTTKDISRIDCEIVDLLGKSVFASDYSPVSDGEQEIHFTLPGVAPGYYVLKLTQKNQIIGIQKLIIQN
jgi:hypothetical protein